MGLQAKATGQAPDHTFTTLAGKPLSTGENRATVAEIMEASEAEVDAKSVYLLSQKARVVAHKEL